MQPTDLNVSHSPISPISPLPIAKIENETKENQLVSKVGNLVITSHAPEAKAINKASRDLSTSPVVEEKIDGLFTKLVKQGHTNPTLEKYKANPESLCDLRRQEVFDVFNEISSDVDAEFLNVLIDLCSKSPPNVNTPEKTLLSLVQEESLKKLTANDSNIEQKKTDLGEKDLIIDSQSFAESNKGGNYLTHVKIDGKTTLVEMDKKIFQNLWTMCAPKVERMQEGIVAYHQFIEFIKNPSTKLSADEKEKIAQTLATFIGDNFDQLGKDNPQVKEFVDVLKTAQHDKAQISEQDPSKIKDLLRKSPEGYLIQKNPQDPHSSNVNINMMGKLVTVAIKNEELVGLVAQKGGLKNNLIVNHVLTYDNIKKDLNLLNLMPSDFAKHVATLIIKNNDVELTKVLLKDKSPAAKKILEETYSSEQSSLNPNTQVLYPIVEYVLKHKIADETNFETKKADFIKNPKSLFLLKKETNDPDNYKVLYKLHNGQIIEFSVSKKDLAPIAKRPENLLNEKLLLTGISIENLKANLNNIDALPDDIISEINLDKADLPFIQDLIKHNSHNATALVGRAVNARVSSSSLPMDTETAAFIFQHKLKIPITKSEDIETQKSQLLSGKAGSKFILQIDPGNSNALVIHSLYEGVLLETKLPVSEFKDIYSSYNPEFEQKIDDFALKDFDNIKNHLAIVDKFNDETASMVAGSISGKADTTFITALEERHSPGAKTLIDSIMINKMKTHYVRSSDTLEANLRELVEDSLQTYFVSEHESDPSKYTLFYLSDSDEVRQVSLDKATMRQHFLEFNGDKDKVIEMLKGIPESVVREVELQEADLGSNFMGDPYFLTLTVDEEKQKPLEVLDKLNQLFKEETCLYLSVHYTDQPGLDQGGLGRQMISNLFSAAVEEMKFKKFPNGLYRPKLQTKEGGDGTTPLTIEERKNYQNLGQMMMFCINAQRPYPIGMLFDHGVFLAIPKFTDEHLSKDFDSIDLTHHQEFTEMFDIFCEMNKNLESELLMVKQMMPFLKSQEEVSSLKVEEAEKFKKEVYGLVTSFLDDKEIKGLNINPNNIGKREYEALQNVLRSQIAPMLKESLAPLFEIAKGMKDSTFFPVDMDAIRGADPQLVSEKLQGVLTRDTVADSIKPADSSEGNPAIPSEKLTWMKNWVLDPNTTDDQIKQFVFAMTGSTALADNVKLVTVNASVTGEAEAKNVRIGFHTCFNRVDIPYNNIASQEDFNAAIVGSIAGSEFTAA